MSDSRPRAGDPALDFTLIEAATGQPVTLSTLWQERAVVLLFYRGPWCGVCHQHLGQVRKRYDEVRDLDGEVVAVFPGEAEYLRPYYARRKLPFPLLADEEGVVIDRYGVRITWALFHRGIPHPAAFVIDRGGVVRFADVRRQHYFRVPVGTLVARVAECSGPTPPGRGLSPPYSRVLHFAAGPIAYSALKPRR